MTDGPQDTPGADLRLEGRRLEIIQAAGRAFAHKGYAPTTVKDIAAEAGIAPGTIYLYFAGKRDILEDFFDYVIDVAITRLDDLADLPLEDALAGLFCERFTLLREHLGIMKVLLSEAMFDGALATRLREGLSRRVIQRVAQFLTSRTSGQLTEQDIHALVAMFPGIILSQGVLLPSLSSEMAAPPQEAARAMARVLVHGIRGMQQGGDDACQSAPDSEAFRSRCVL